MKVRQSMRNINSNVEPRADVKNLPVVAFQMLPEVAIGDVLNNENPLTALLRVTKQLDEVQVINLEIHNHCHQQLGGKHAMGKKTKCRKTLTWDNISTSVRNSTDSRCSNASFFPRLMATMRPSRRRPLYTMPNPPCPILFDGEKFDVERASSDMVNVSAPAGLGSISWLEYDWKPRKLL